jgi:thiol:disulfide interchange protein DsbG
MKAFISAVVLGISLVSAAAHAASPSPQEREALFSELEKADAIVEGARNVKSTLYVFFDANCLYCNLTWKALQHYEKVGLRAHWVPVAYQKPDSMGRAAAILEALYRDAALHYNARKYDAAKFEGGIQPLENPKAETIEKVQANTRLMQRFGAPGTPALAWKDKAGQVHFKVGLPRLSELAGITGLPEQKIDDPELARFR